MYRRAARWFPEHTVRAIRISSRTGLCGSSSRTGLPLFLVFSSNEHLIYDIHEAHIIRLNSKAWNDFTAALNEPMGLRLNELLERDPIWT